jgi:hypothetical protein
MHPKRPSLHGSNADGPLAILLSCALLLALVLAAMLGWLAARQLTALQAQTTRLEDTRRDAVQLLRVQADLNQLGTAMRDLQADEGRSVAAAATQFDQVRHDLTDALKQHVAITPDEQSFLSTPVEQFWKNVDLTFTLARGGHEPEARTQLRLSLQRQHAGLTTTTAYLLLENNEAQRVDVEQLQSIIATLRRQTILLVSGLLTALLIAIAIVALRRPMLLANLEPLDGDTRQRSA